MFDELIVRSPDADELGSLERAGSAIRYPHRRCVSASATWLGEPAALKHFTIRATSLANPRPQPFVRVGVRPQALVDRICGAEVKRLPRQRLRRSRTNAQRTNRLDIFVRETCPGATIDDHACAAGKPGGKSGARPGGFRAARPATGRTGTTKNAARGVHIAICFPIQTPATTAIIPATGLPAQYKRASRRSPRSRSSRDSNE